MARSQRLWNQEIRRWEVTTDDRWRMKIDIIVKIFSRFFYTIFRVRKGRAYFVIYEGH